MPAKSAAQKRLMDAAAHNPAFAKKVGIPTKVAKEYSEASKGMTFRKGEEMKESKAMAKKEIAFMQKKGAPKSMIKHEKAEYGMKKGGSVAASKMGAVKTTAPSRDGVAVKGKTKGKMVKMMRGGKAC